LKLNLWIFVSPNVQLWVQKNSPSFPHGRTGFTHVTRGVGPWHSKHSHFKNFYSKSIFALRLATPSLRKPRPLHI